MTTGLELISAFERKKPGWTFIVSSGYEEHRDSHGKRYFCHLMAPGFPDRGMDEDGPEWHVWAFGDDAIDAIVGALSKLDIGV